MTEGGEEGVVVAIETAAGWTDITGTMASDDITVVVEREDAAEATAGIKATVAEAKEVVASEAEAGVIAAETVAWEDVVGGRREVGGHTVELVDTAAPGSLAIEEEEEVAGATAA